MNSSRSWHGSSRKPKTKSDTQTSLTSRPQDSSGLRCGHPPLAGQNEDCMRVAPGGEHPGNQLQCRQAKNGQGVDPRAEDPVLDPGHDRRAERAESEPIDRLESGLLKNRLELLESVAVAHVPAVLEPAHPDVAGVGLPVAVGGGDIDEAMLVQKLMDLP